MEKENLIEKVRKLIELHKSGLLGGEFMPEDSNPHLDSCSEENLVYFTLPMALNYQRNSYALWESALRTWEDNSTKDVFCLERVVKLSEEELKSKLTAFRLAIQQNKQPQIWRILATTFFEDFGSIKNMLKTFDFDIEKIKQYITSNKKKFPYLSGEKILNYWLYVLTQQTGFEFKNRQEITVAPDTHILQASVKLGVIEPADLQKSNIREIVSEKWKEILAGTQIQPIDIHTPFWLWSRNGFSVEI